MLKQVVFLLKVREQLLTQNVSIEQINDPNPRASKLVLIGRTDPSSRRANGSAVAGLLSGLFNSLVVRHDEVRIVRNE